MESMFGDGGNAGALNLVGTFGTIVDKCQFLGNRGYGAGAIVMAGGQVEITNSRFIGNYGFYNGGAVASTWNYYGDSQQNSMNMRNCLFLNNSAVNDYADLYMENDFRTTLTNVTIVSGSSRHNNSVWFSHDSTVANSIITGNVNNRYGLVANNNCVINDWSARAALVISPSIRN